MSSIECPSQLSLWSSHPFRCAGAEGVGGWHQGGPEDEISSLEGRSGHAAAVVVVEAVEVAVVGSGTDDVAAVLKMYAVLDSKHVVAAAPVVDCWKIYPVAGKLEPAVHPTLNKNVIYIL